MRPFRCFDTAADARIRIVYGSHLQEKIKQAGDRIPENGVIMMSAALGEPESVSSQSRVNLESISAAAGPRLAAASGLTHEKTHLLSPRHRLPSAASQTLDTRRSWFAQRPMG